MIGHRQYSHLIYSHCYSIFSGEHQGYGFTDVLKKGSQKGAGCIITDVVDRWVPVPVHPPDPLLSWFPENPLPAWLLVGSYVSFWKEYNFGINQLAFETIPLPLNKLFHLGKAIFPLLALDSSSVKWVMIHPFWTCYKGWENLIS